MLIFIAVCWVITTPLLGLAVYEQVDEMTEDQSEQGEEQNASHL